MARPSKLTPDIQKKIGENIALGLTYSIGCRIGWCNLQNIQRMDEQGQDREIWEILSILHSTFKSGMLMPQKVLLERFKQSGRCWKLSSLYVDARKTF